MKTVNSQVYFTLSLISLTFFSVFFLHTFLSLSLSSHIFLTFLSQLVVMIGVRKLLDFVFTQRELKILDDVMPEHRRKEIEDLTRDEEELKGGLDPLLGGIIPNASSGNVAIPLANGTILKIPVDKFTDPPSQTAINITEQLAKSGAWKNVDQKNPKSGSGSKGDDPSSR